jgi:hypothetical protein
MTEKKDPSTKEEGNLSELLKQMAASTEKGDSALGGATPAPKFEARPSAATTQRDATFLGNSSGRPDRAAFGAESTTASKQPTVQYVDDHNIREIFADGLNTVHFDGHTLRIEFGVTRAKRSESAASQVLERLPACRLVLGPQAITELKNLMQKISAPQNPAPVAGKEQK